jgi:hypothetical protein
MSRTRSIVLLSLLALPALAAAQYDPNSPVPPPPPPPGRQRRPPPPPGAYAPRETGLTLSARVGYGSPVGKISNEGDPRLDDLIDFKVPIWLEVGYRFNPKVWGGFYVELAPMSVNSNFCLAGRSCDAGSIRFGVDMQLHLQPRGQVDPWIGIGIGGEFVSIDAFDATVNDISTFTYDGLELPLLEGGLDLAVTPHFTLGPFVSYSFARYMGAGISTPGFVDESFDIHRRTWHGWFEVGLKGTFKL